MYHFPNFDIDAYILCKVCLKFTHRLIIKKIKPLI